jgi:O-antigen/teichoic acid export membrane protein
MDKPNHLEPAPSAIQVEETKAAQRGFFLITGAKVWFLAAGTVLNIGLPRFLGDPARFGDFAVVNTLISIVNMVIIIAALQVVSKRVSENPRHAYAVRRDAMRMMFVVGGLTSLTLFFGADIISEHLFRDSTLAGFLAIGALIPFFYGLYGVMVGVLNGLKLFAKQALFDVGFATMKVALMVGLVVVGLGVSGAFIGFVVAAGVISVVSILQTRRIVASDEKVEAGPPIASFLFQVMGYTLFVNVLVQADVLVIKASTFEPILESLRNREGQVRVQLIADALQVPNTGLVEVLGTESTAMLAGLYRATKNVSLISYQAVIAITFVIFPLVSRSTFSSDLQATRTYVRQTFRVACLLVVFVATMIAAGDEPMLTLLFGDAYAYAAPALLPLLAGMACFAILSVVGSILTAGGRPFDALLIAGFAAVLQLISLVFIVGSSEPSPDVLRVSGLVTLLAISVPLLVACWVVYRRFDAAIPVLSVVRAVAVAAAALFAVSFVETPGFMGIFVRCSLACVVFIAGAIFSGEITRHELETAKRLIGRAK